MFDVLQPAQHSPPSTPKAAAHTAAMAAFDWVQLRLGESWGEVRDLCIIKQLTSHGSLSSLDWFEGILRKPPYFF